jgi:hypothetical protein
MNRLQAPDQRGLNGSKQHSLGVYWEQSQRLKSFASVDSNKTLPGLVLAESSQTDQFLGENCRIN